MTCDLCGYKFSAFISNSMECPYCGFIQECDCCGITTFSNKDGYLRCDKCQCTPVEYLEEKLKQIIG